MIQVKWKTVIKEEHARQRESTTTGRKLKEKQWG